MGVTTPVLALYKPTSATEAGWGDLVNANWDAIEAAAQRLAVRPMTTVEAGGSRYYAGIPQGGVTNSWALNRVTLNPIVFARTVSIDQLAVRCVTGAASAVARLGLYANHVDFDYGGPLIVDAGTVDCSTTGDKTIDITPVTFEAFKLYWGACATQGASGAALIGQANGLGSLIGGGSLVNAVQFRTGLYKDGVSGALDDPFAPTSDGVTNTISTVAVRVADVA